jgi:hypothetical protein
VLVDTDGAICRRLTAGLDKLRLKPKGLIIRWGFYIANNIIRLNRGGDDASFEAEFLCVWKDFGVLWRASDVARFAGDCASFIRDV